MKKRGFTIIELMVAVSIIGMLSSVTVTSLSGARTKASDSKVIQTFTNIRTQAEIAKDDYPNFCLNMSYLYESIGGECAISGSAWSIYAPLKLPKPGRTGLCLDFTGLQQQIHVSQRLCNPVTCMIAPCMPN